MTRGMASGTTPTTAAGTAPGTAAPTTRRQIQTRAAAMAATVMFGSAACAPGATGQPATKEKDTGPIRVQQWDASNTPFGVWLEGYYTAFPAKSGIQTTIVPRKSDVSAPEEQAVWVAAGDVPDVFFRTGRGLVPYAAFASKNVIRPLDPFIKRDKWDQSDFWPNLIKLMTAKNQQWVIPQDFNQTLFGYNVAFFQQAGAAAPPSDWKDQSWTWNELVKRAQQVQGRIGTDGTRWAMGRPQANWQLYMWSNGGDYTNPDASKVTLTEPAVIEALDFVAKLMHTYRVAPTPQTPLPPGNTLATQSVALDVLPASGLNAIRGQNKDLNFDTCLVARGAARYVSGGGGGGYVMSATTKHPDAAWDLLKYIGDKEYAVNKVKNGALGPRISTAREVFVQPGLPPAHASVYFDGPANAQWEPNLTNWNDVQVEVDKALQPLWRGEQSAREAASNAQRAFETLRPQGEVFR
jgi:multiple sugar transport system substrate-binding protein